jgi:hypothetical protein
MIAAGVRRAACRQTPLSGIDIFAGRGVAAVIEWRQLFDIRRTAYRGKENWRSEIGNLRGGEHASQRRGYSEGGAVGCRGSTACGVSSDSASRALPKEALARDFPKKGVFYQTNPTEKCGSTLE